MCVCVCVCIASWQTEVVCEPKALFSIVTTQRFKGVGDYFP